MTQILGQPCEFQVRPRGAAAAKPPPPPQLLQQPVAAAAGPGPGEVDGISRQLATKKKARGSVMELFKHPAVLAIAAEAGRSAGQVLIRYGIQRYPDSLVSIPKSSNAGRIAANFDVFGWELTEAQMAALEALDCGFRYFISYLKRPDNERLWHEGVIEGADPTGL